MAEVDEFSYASPDDPRFKRLVIQMIERISGQPELKRMYLEHQNHPVPGETFWQAAVRKLQLNIQMNDDALGEIPPSGPVIVVANHPFGVLDGLVVCWLIARVRKDFKVLTNALLNRAEEIKPFLLPIDFEETKAALETNIKTRAEAKTLLEKGGCLVIFPGGTVSTTPTLLARKAKDPEWKTFTARMIVQGKAPVVPVYFAGQNSRLFQVASHVSMTLRLSLLFKEVHDRIGGDMVLRIGKRIAYEELKAITDRKQLMEFLRDRTYALESQVPKLKRRRRRRELVE
jgi:putative hemolysin